MEFGLFCNGLPFYFQISFSHRYVFIGWMYDNTKDLEEIDDYHGIEEVDVPCRQVVDHTLVINPFFCVSIVFMWKRYFYTEEVIPCPQASNNTPLIIDTLGSSMTDLSP